jgi:hypothetical protein
MGVFFQLFSAADLQRLAVLPGNKLDELRTLISNEMVYSPDVRAQIKIRADQVFRQLAPSFTAPLPLPTLPAPPAPLPPLLEQFFMPADLDQLDADPTMRAEKRKILEWAIRCEKDSSPYVLEVIMRTVYAWFAQQLPPPPLPLPDAVYSPFSKEYKIIRAADPPDNPALVIRDWPTNLWGP